jgi:hypothetical protein
MDVLAVGQAERHVRRRFLDRIAHRDPDAALELPNIFEIGVEARPIARTQILLEGAELAGHRVEDAGILLSSSQALFRARPVAKQALEDNARVHLRRQRLGR